MAESFFPMNALYDGLTARDIEEACDEMEQVANYQQLYEDQQELAVVQAILLDQNEEKTKELDARVSALVIAQARSDAELEESQALAHMNVLQLAAAAIELREAEQEIVRLKRIEYLSLAPMARELCAHNKESSYWKRANTDGRTRSGAP